MENIFTKILCSIGLSLFCLLAPNAIASTNTYNSLTSNKHSSYYAASLSYSTSILNEISTNNGSFTETITVTQTGGTFDGTLNEDFINSNKATITNLPAGLTASVTYTSTTEVVLAITGNANNHGDVEDISNLTILFENTAFTTGDNSIVADSEKSDISLNFNDPKPNNAIQLDGVDDYASSSQFALPQDFTAEGWFRPETVAGNVFLFQFKSNTEQLNLRLNNGILISWNGFGGNNTTGSTTINANQWIHVALVREGITTRIILNGTLEVENTNSGGYTGETINLFLGAKSASGILSNFFTGKIDEFRVWDQVLTPAEITAAMNDQLVGDETNLLASYSMNELSGTTIPDNSPNGYDVSLENMTNDDWVAGDWTTTALTYSTSSVVEAVENDGSIAETIDVTLSNGDFLGTIGDDFIADNKLIVSNLPTGLTAVGTKISNTSLQISFTGNAVAHEVSDNISNLTFTFQDAAFSNNNAAAFTSYNISNLNINYSDSPNNSLAFDGVNDYAVSPNLTLGDDFSFEVWVKPTLVSSGNVYTVGQANSTTENISLKVNTDGTLSVFFKVEDQSSDTYQLNSISTVQAGEWSHIAYTNEGGVDAKLYINGVLDDSNPTSLPRIFTSITNDLTIGKKLYDTEDTDHFPGEIDELRIWDKVLTQTEIVEKMNFEAIGNETDLNRYIDFNYLTGTFFASSGSSVAVGALHNMTNDDWVLATWQITQLNYFSSSFTENTSTNSGSIVETISVAITGDLFTGNTNDNFVSDNKVTFTNLPAGLVGSVIRTSETTVDISLTGSATAHENANDIANLSIVFANTAFTGNDATLIGNYNKSDFTIDFIDAYTTSISYNKTIFLESIDNNGSINEAVVLTLSDDTFAADVITGNRISTSNVPTGLTASFIRDSDTQITMTLSGTVSAHATTNSVDNLTVTFGDGAFTTYLNTVVANYNKTDLGIYFMNQAPGNGLILDGVDEYVDFGTDTPFFPDKDAWTVEIWVNATDWTPTSTEKIISSTEASGMAFILNGTQLIAEYFDNGLGSYQTANYILPSGFAGWHHVAMTFDGRYLTLYIDGEPMEVNDRGSTGGAIKTGNSSIYLGAEYSSSPLLFFDGKYDELRIWSKVKTNEELINEMFATLDGTESNLVSYFNMNCHKGSVLYDRTSNNNHGALQNMEEADWINSDIYTHYNGTTWSNSTPTTFVNTVIGEGVNFAIDAPFNVNNLLISTGATVSIDAGGSATLADRLITEGTLTLDNGEFITQNGVNENSGTGNVNYTLSGAGIDKVYHYFASPYTSLTFNWGENPFRYNPEDAVGTDSTGLSRGWNAYTENMIPGRGYISENVGTQVISGIPNNGTVTYTVTNGTFTGYNLIGNPYLAPISASLFIAENGESGTNRIANTLYFWDHDESNVDVFDNSDYATWHPTLGAVAGGDGTTPNGNIAVGQGFFVSAASTGDVTFTNAMRTTTNNQFFREKADDVPLARFWLDADGDNGEFNQILIAFKDDASDYLDVQYDSKKFKGNPSFSLYSLMSDTNEHYVIQALDNVGIARKVVPIGLSLANAKTITFSVPKMDNMGSYEIILRDRVSNKTYDLKNTDATISLPAGDNINRLEMIFDTSSPLALLDLENELKVGIAKGVIQLFGHHEFHSLEVFNFSGQSVLQSNDFNLTGKVEHSLKPDYYIVRLSNNDKTEFVKIKVE
ncbi:LamG domain-containing protein [Flammeovirga pectinis]|uniref:LamG domain-containing protein n=1 Tax=Flammeovirga pectinis TaxID=2494373 RepID=A0A3Q9FQ62_9BACT|nr:LamG domain-containing protein [Flammeovirga pectinis]AZQ62741.1 LamG domain-containing protein [Flammeovirga pectinis]